MSKCTEELFHSIGNYLFLFLFWSRFSEQTFLYTVEIAHLSCKALKTFCL